MHAQKLPTFPLIAISNQQDEQTMMNPSILCCSANKESNETKTILSVARRHARATKARTSGDDEEAEYKDGKEELAIKYISDEEEESIVDGGDEGDRG